MVTRLLALKAAPAPPWPPWPRPRNWSGERMHSTGADGFTEERGL